jgi:hypothetical protein
MFFPQCSGVNIWPAGRLRPMVPLHVAPLTISRAASRVQKIRANAPGPAIWYNGICKISRFQSIWYCWAVGSLFRRIVMSTIITKNRWLSPSMFQ